MALSHQENPLSRLASQYGCETFGGWIGHILNKHKLTQKQMAKVVEPCLDHRMVGALKRDERYPLYKELLPLYRGLVEQLRLPLTPDERDLFAYLAQLRIGERQKGETVSASQWETLAAELLLLTPNKKSKFHLIRKDDAREVPEPEATQEEDPDSRRLQAISDVRRTETRHLLERDEWVQKMLTYPEMTPQMKLVVVQAGIGAGKSCARALLIQHLVARSEYYLIPYLFEEGESKTPEDYLHEFLATVLADLTFAKVSNEGKHQQIPETISQLFTEIGKRADRGQRVIFLLDDMHHAFPTVGQCPPCWASFFEAFAREPHSATMYVFTRAWPWWDDRYLAFIEQRDLPELSLSACLAIWQRFGFSDVPEKMLRDVCTRCGNNPKLIEIIIGQCQKRTFATRWGSNAANTTSALSPQAARLEALLTQETLFNSTMDAKSRAVLQQVLTCEFSHQARQLLECLACSPLGLPVSLIKEEFVGALDILDDLACASVVDLNMAAADRAAVVPFVREALLLSVANDGRRDAIESRVTDLYTYWLSEVPDFKDDREKAGLIAEMIVRYLRQRQLLKAAELFIQFGWLCALFGQAGRIQRVYEEVVKEDRGKDLGDTYEAGRLLLSYHLLMVFGQKINRQERDRDFHVARELYLAGKIVLRPNTEISLAHYLTLKMIYEKRYQYAYDFLQETFDRISVRVEVAPEDRASFLHSKSNLLAEWGNAFKTDQPKESKRLYSECVAILTEAIHTWELCLSRALPVQEHHYHFKIAKALNDLSCYSRILGYLEQAEQAIIRCLALKEEKKASSPSSLAISYGEFAQILAAKGEYKNAEVKSDEAIQRINTFIQSGGDPFAIGNKGTLLFERAQIYELQGRLSEAYQLVQEALPLLDENRASYRLEAEQLRDRIQSIQESSIRYHLDSDWYSKYRTLAQYDAISRLSQAGPFSPEEQHSWNELFPQYRDLTVWKQLARIIRQSRDREFEQSVSEGRLPVLWYPAIDIDDINARMQGFLSLKERIEREEKNAIVRRLYVRKIEEDLLNLRLISCTHSQDVEGIRTCNEAIYGRISQPEMTVALRELFSMLTRAEKHPLASEAAQVVIKQLKEWGLFASDFLHEKDTPVKQGYSAKLQLWGTTRVSPHTMQRFYEEVIQEYGFTEWRVVLSADRDTPSPDPDLCVLYLPAAEDSTVLSIAELLTEEIETHMLRSASGKQSKLALLGSGTAGYLPTEEGLAAYAVDEMRQSQGLGHKARNWLETLLPGLAQGIMTPAHSFETLYAFLSKVLLAGQLASGRYETVESAKPIVQRMTFRMVMRTFRGVTDLTVAGVCNAKNRVYLQGHRKVASTVATSSVGEERLFVGAIGTDDLSDMEELHILQPAIRKLNLACDPDLFERITRLGK